MQLNDDKAYALKRHLKCGPVTSAAQGHMSCASAKQTYIREAYGSLIVAALGNGGCRTTSALQDDLTGYVYTRNSQSMQLAHVTARPAGVAGPSTGAAAAGPALCALGSAAGAVDAPLGLPAAAGAGAAGAGDVRSWEACTVGAAGTSTRSGAGTGAAGGSDAAGEACGTVASSRMSSVSAPPVLPAGGVAGDSSDSAVA